MGPTNTCPLNMWMDAVRAQVRLLDPPLHEFMPSPNDTAAVAEMARYLGCDEKAVRDRIEELEEVNPMLGFRGCRLGIIHPEISRMQVRALLQVRVLFLILTTTHKVDCVVIVYT